MKRSSVILASLTLLLAGHSLAYAEIQSDPDLISDIPADAQSLIPDNSRVLSAWSADLTNDGHADWAVLYVSPGGADVAAAHAIILDDRGGWHIADDQVRPGIDASHSNMLSQKPLGSSLDGVPAIIFHSSTRDPFGTQLSVTRWNGSEFQTVFSDATDMDFAVQDLDHDGVTDISKEWDAGCEGYDGRSSHLAIYRWDNGQFREETDRFPSMLAKNDGVERSILISSSQAPDGTAAGRACSWQVRDELSALSHRWVRLSSIEPSAVGAFGPQVANDNRLFRVTRDAHLQMSTTQGRTWEQVGDKTTCGYDDWGVNMLFSPQFATDNTLVLTRAGVSPCGGLWPALFSHDAGVTWTPLGPTTAKRVEVMPKQPEVEFSPTYASDHRLWVFAGADTMTSGDTGRTWNRITSPVAGADLRSFVASGTENGSPLLLLTLNDPKRDPGRRYFRSTDLGQTWTELTESFRDPNTLAVADTKFIVGDSGQYAFAVSPGGIVYSADAGQSWQAWKGQTPVAVSPSGCGVELYARDLILACNSEAHPSQASFSSPLDLRNASVKSVDQNDHGETLVTLQTPSGLWTYRFS